MFNFKNREKDDYYDLFVKSATYFNKGTLMLDAVMMDYSTAEKEVKKIIDLEHKADRVNDEIIDKLNRTFITPIDREDIYSIANALDDGVDELQGTMQRIVMYKAGKGGEGAVSMTKLLIRATKEIIHGFSLLKEILKNRDEILDTTYKISKIESEGDNVYRREIASLFENVTDPIELIKWKDIFEHLEETMDRCEKIGDLIRGVVMKYA